MNGPLIAFINNDKTNGAVTFAFDDQKANRFGVGTNLAITTAGETPLTLRREIQTGGGFMSFDAPVAHFGIGTSPEVSGLSIGWSDGSMTDIPVSLPANYRYRISRLSE